jgi:parvulin-like peptidyl-prolyl isomerase
MIKFGVIFRTPPSEVGSEVARRLREEAIAERLVHARAARERIAGGADFGELASELSDDPVTKANAGRLPAGFSHVGWPRDFQDALDGLAVGELSEPLYGRGGWWLVRVNAVEVKPLAEVRDGIEADLIARGPDQDEVGRKRAALAEGLEVEILPSMWARGVPSDELPEDVLAMRINGEPIARKTYALWLLHVRGEAAARHFVEHWVVERQAEQFGIEVGEDEIRSRAVEYVERLVLRDHAGDREAWKAYLARGTRDEEAFLRDLTVRMRIELLCERLLMRERTIGPEDVRAHWEEVYGEDGRTIRVRMILLRVSLPKPESGLSREQLQALVAAESERVRERAAALASRARDGEGFAALARKHSQEPESAARGGTLPGRFRPEQWPEEIARAVQSLEPGDVSDPLDLGTAWVVFQIESVRRAPFDDVRAELLEELAAARPSYGDLAAYRNRLMQQLEIEVLPGMYE